MGEIHGKKNNRHNMIGPKQFDIGHKVKARRDLNNILTTKMISPKFKYREHELRELDEPLEEQFKSSLLKLDKKEDSNNIIPISLFKTRKTSTIQLEKLKDINPLTQRIRSHKFKNNEDDLKDLDASLEDKFKFPSLELEEEEIKPLSRSVPISLERNENNFKKIAGSFLDQLNLLKKVAPPKRKETISESPTKETKESIKDNNKEAKELSEDVINRITYKVFQNIREYFNQDNMVTPIAPERNRSIKIEIDF